MSKFKIVLFDMDGTLLSERTIFVFAKKKGFINHLEKLFYGNDIDFYKRSIEIAKLLKGLESKELLEIFRTIKLNKNVEKVIKELKKRGLKTAIVTASYQFNADDLKKRLNMDYAFANNLIIDEGIITGKLEINNKSLISDFTGNTYSICKEQILKELCKDLAISVDDSIAVGDGIVDIGMIKTAGLGMAFNASDKVNKHADVIIKDMKKLLEYI